MEQEKEQKAEDGQEQKKPGSCGEFIEQAKTSGMGYVAVAASSRENDPSGMIWCEGIGVNSEGDAVKFASLVIFGLLQGIDQNSRIRILDAAARSVRERMIADGCPDPSGDGIPNPPEGVPAQ